MDPTLREFYLREIASLEAEIQRIKDAQRLMRQASKAVRAGNLIKLRSLGFDEEHIQMLTTRHAVGMEIFPGYTMRGNRQMLRRMQVELSIAINSIW